jgi:hypothetical protein
MPKGITKLTAAQAARLGEWRDRWIKIGLSCEPMQDSDRREVEQAIRSLYRRANLPEPKAVVFVPSWFVMRVASGIAAGVIHVLRNGWPEADASEAQADLAVRDAVGDPVYGAVYGAVENAVHGAVDGTVDGAVSGAVGDMVDGAVNNAVRDAVGGAVSGAVRDAVFGAVRDAVGSAVSGAAENAVRDAVDNVVGSAVRGAVDGTLNGDRHSNRVVYLLRCAAVAHRMDADHHWWRFGSSAWASFFRDICDLDLAEWEAFADLETIDVRGGQYSLHADFVMVSDRPKIIRRDAGGRLHASNGPAIAWRDGYALYFWHGLRIDHDHQWIIAQPERLSPDAIERESNAELRRVMLEAFGFERYLAARQARVIAADELHGRPRRLLEVGVADARIRIVEVTNGSLEPDGTRRKFHLGAMPGNTPHEAIAASYGIASAHYCEAVRT